VFKIRPKLQNLPTELLAAISVGDFLKVCTGRVLISTMDYQRCICTFSRSPSSFAACQAVTPRRFPSFAVGHLGCARAAGVRFRCRRGVRPSSRSPGCLTRWYPVRGPSLGDKQHRHSSATAAQSRNRRGRSFARRMRQDGTDNGRELGSMDSGSSAEIHGGGEQARDP
jgi:hypothetical protein